MATLPKGQGVIPLPPFKAWLASNIPAVYDNTMTYYEELCALLKYLQDQVVPALNDNASTITVLSNYVENYFSNLDVQEEINNKLDQMAEDGTLQEIITSYIQANTAWTFDTVADMKTATNLVNGSYARTLGFHAINDGGGATYYITDSGTADEKGVIAVGDLYANLVVSSFVNPEMFGAKGDGTTDDYSAFTAMLSYTENKGINWVVLSNKIYLLNNELTISRPIKITGQNNTRSLITPTIKGTSTGNAVIVIGANVSGCIFEDFNVDGSSVASSGFYFSNNSYHNYLKNIQVSHVTYGYNIGRSWNNTFINCIADTTTQGFRTTNTVTSTTWESCVVYNSQYGWYIDAACIYSSLISCGTDHTDRGMRLAENADLVAINFGIEDYEGLATVYGKLKLIGVFTYNRRTVPASTYTITGTGEVDCYSCKFDEADTFSINKLYGVLSENGVSNDNNITPSRIKTIENKIANVPSYGIRQETGTISQTTASVELAHSLSSSNCNLIGFIIMDSNYKLRSEWLPISLFESGYGCSIKWNDSNYIVITRVDSSHVSVTVTGSGYGVRIYSSYFGSNTNL